MELPLMSRHNERDKMGEVNVRVRLTNAVDAEMAERGLLDPGQVRSREVDAIVDTGATRSVIPPEIAEEIGLRIRRETIATLADGRRVSAGISSPISFELEGRETQEDAYIMGDTVLIGQTVLESTDLLVDCNNRKVIPNPAHPDGPALRI